MWAITQMEPGQAVVREPLLIAHAHTAIPQRGGRELAWPGAENEATTRLHLHAVVARSTGLLLALPAPQQSHGSL
jgi:hypothetical protein